MHDSLAVTGAAALLEQMAAFIPDGLINHP
jgi:hypothetical protein